MTGINIKEKITNNVKQAIKEFEAREDVVTHFGEPIIAYIDAKDQLFDLLFDKGLTEHPKNIYRPGNTVITYFIPYAEEITKSNKGSKQVSEQWRRASIESAWLAMKLNRTIRQTLNIIGRLSSILNTQLDWDEQKHQASWSHKLSAYVSGIAELGPAGSIHTKAGFGGCCCSVITDGKFAEPSEPCSQQQLEGIYQKLLADCCYEGAQNVSCSEAMINACPGNAISENGIDRAKCQKHCKTIDEYIPSPDVCGKCFSFK